MLDVSSSLLQRAFRSGAPEGLHDRQPSSGVFVAIIFFSNDLRHLEVGREAAEVIANEATDCELALLAIFVGGGAEGLLSRIQVFAAISHSADLEHAERADSRQVVVEIGRLRTEDRLVRAVRRTVEGVRRELPAAMDVGYVGLTQETSI